MTLTRLRDAQAYLVKIIEDMQAAGNASFTYPAEGIRRLIRVFRLLLITDG
jgi:hypothetical protein